MNSNKLLLASAAVLMVAGLGPAANAQTREFSFAYDQPKTTGYGFAGDLFEIEEFSPYGYDERQYCSPGFNLPVGVWSRTPHGCFPEYHTSADDVDFVDAASLADTVAKLVDVLHVLEGDATTLNRNPKCEPQLGRRGLYAMIGGHGGKQEMEFALLWVLNLSDGSHSLLDIAERSGLPFSLLRTAADTLIHHELLEEVPAATAEGRPEPRAAQMRAE